MTVALIAALARNGTIGNQGKLPWHIRADLQRFKRLTLGHPIVMGRKTFESIGRALPGRRNIVLSRNAQLAVPAGVEVFRGLAEAVRDCEERGATRVFVIGGADLYRQALPIADELLLTRVPRDVDGDTKFPAYDASQWRETAREETPECTFVDYRKTNVATALTQADQKSQ